MGQKEKLIARSRSRPKDMAFEEAETLLNELSFHRSNKGRTSGPRVVFISEKHGSILFHEPHNGKELRAYQVKQLIDKLEQEDLI